MVTVYESVAAAVAGQLRDGMSIAVGGFGLCGVPFELIDAVRLSGVRDLEIISNNMGVDGDGLGVLLESKQVRRVVASYVGENREFARQLLAGEIEVELVPQGTLAERLRAGGAGIPAFFTPTGVSTTVADNKRVEVFDGRRCVLERGIVADVSLVHAWRGDKRGNLIYRHTARNFNPVVAMAGATTIAQVEQFSELPLDPDSIHTPAIFIDHLVVAREYRPRIERVVTRDRTSEAVVT